MADIASQINQILNSEEGMNQIKSLASSLGLNLNNQNNNQNSNQINNNTSQSLPDLSSLSSLFGGNNINSNTNTNDTNSNISTNNYSNNINSNDNQANPLATLGQLFGNNSNTNQQQGGINIDPSMIFKLQGLLSNFSTNDNNTQLLLALKCHLSEERQKKVDDAIKVMQLIKILPLIKEMGLFGGDNK